MAALPEPYRHIFTPDELPASLDTLVPLFEKLDAMPIATNAELAGFLAAWNETQCWVDDYAATIRLSSMRYLDEEEKQARWSNLSAELLPEVSRWQDRLARKLLASPSVMGLEETPYAPFVRKVRKDVELFREVNVPLLQRERELCSEYYRISGGWNIDFEGESRTWSEMLGCLEDPARDIREAAWLASGEAVAQTSDELEELFEELFELRRQIAENAGFETYRDYAFREKLRDYDPETCHEFARAVEAVVLPFERELADAACRRTGADAYRPWDLRAPDGPPLTPFGQTDELLDGVGRMLTRLDAEIAELYRALRAEHALDLEARPHKARGSFAWWFPFRQRGFIYTSATPTHKALSEVLHEGGHVFHFMLAGAAEAVPFNRWPPMEFNEVASMTMELLAGDMLDEFYSPEDAARAIRQNLRRAVREFTRTMIGDQFQHWLYTNPDHTRAERRAKWVELSEKYAPHIDRSGIDRQYLEDEYHRVLHFFALPFYYIEYAFAQFGALQIAMRASEDSRSALKAYKDAMRLGPQRDARGLYAAAGAEFDPTAESLGRAMDWIRGRLARLRKDR